MRSFFKRLLITLGIIAVTYATYFLIVRKMDNNALEAADAYTAVTGIPTLLPTYFLNGERFYLKIRSQQGDTLMAFGDTGGGVCMIPPAVVDKLEARDLVKIGIAKAIMPIHIIPFSSIVADPAIPVPMLQRHLLIRQPFSAYAQPHFMVPPEDEETRMVAKLMKLDLFLGQNFFMGKAWTIDYPARQLWVHTPLAATEAGKPGVQRIGLKKNKAGAAIFGHPSMVVEIDGELIEVLFDTGASIILSEEGKKALATNDATIGGSFIAASVFDKWRQKHPDWKYYPGADMKRDVIEVPVVSIGGHKVGPVLFAKRPDEAWSEGMIHTMDKVVRGAIGGSALKYLRVTIDYNSQLIRFTMPEATASVQQ